MRPGFWQKCRVSFRWCRISLWLVVLAVLCAAIWLNRIGLPNFIKTRLVATLHERGINLEFSRVRVHLTSGIVAENVRVSGAQPVPGPVLTVAEARLQLDYRALLHRRFQVDGLVLRQGKLFLPLSPTNGLQLDNIESVLRFHTNETWSLEHFQADFAGMKIALAGEVAHAPQLRNWKIFQSSRATNVSNVANVITVSTTSTWQAQLQKISDALNQLHFSGTPQLSFQLNGDALDPHSFRLRLGAAAAAVGSPWFEARGIQLRANLAMSAGTPTNDLAAWGFWTNVQPYQLAWSVRAANLRAKKFELNALACAGSWSKPELTISNLSGELSGGHFDASARLDVDTRRLTFTNFSSFDLSAITPLLPEKTVAQLAEISWTQPPVIRVGGSLILPAWTNQQPDWNGEIWPTLALAGRISVANVSARGTPLDAAQVSFDYDRQVWNIPDLVVRSGKTWLEMSGVEEDATRNFHGALHGEIDLASARPFLTDTNAQKGFDLVKLGEPFKLDATASGNLSDAKSLVVSGHVALTNLFVRGQHFGSLATTVTYSNNVLAFVKFIIRTGAQIGTAEAITLDFNSHLLFFTNLWAHGDLEPVVRAIGPKTWLLVEPYHFLGWPTAWINGQIPLADLHGGPEMEAVDMRFDVVKGAPFEWFRLKTTNFVGTLHWRGQTLLLTNVVAAFHNGTADGFAYFDFRVPHDGADYSFAVNMTNVDLHLLIADLALSPTNTLAGRLAGRLVVTNASTEDVDSWRGFGYAHLQNGLIWDVPVISIVSPVLDTISPGLGNSRATEAAGKFQIANGLITTDSLEIRSTMTRLEYVGTIEMSTNEAVNAHVTAHLLRDTWVVGPLVSTALWPVSKLFEYHITGSLQDPKKEPIYVLPKLLLMPFHPIRTLEDILVPGGGSLTNRPSGK
jgi:hypothetical protein